MRQGMERIAILVSLAMLALVMAGCGARDRTVLTGRVVGVHATLKTLYVFDGTNVFALVVDSPALRVLDASGNPSALRDIRPGMEIAVVGRRISQYHFMAEEIRIRRPGREVQDEHEDRASRSPLRERAPASVWRD
jgi:hypothetical protein